MQVAAKTPIQGGYEPLVIEDAREHLEKFSAYFEELMQPERIDELDILKGRVQRINGKDSAFEELITCLMSAIEEYNDPQNFLTWKMHKLSIKQLQPVQCISSRAIRRFLLRKDVSKMCNMLDLLFQYKEISPQNKLHAFVTALKKTTHFFQKQQKDEQILHQDLLKHGINPEKVRSVSFIETTKSLQELTSFLASAFYCTQVENRTSLEVTAQNLWQEFFLAHDTPISISIQYPTGSAEQMSLPKEHFALMLGEKELFASMLVANNSCNSLDTREFSPAHFAAILCSWDMLVLLKNLGADFDLRTKSGATVYDLLKAQGHGISILPKKIPVFKESTLSPGEISKKFLRIYSPTSVHSPYSLFAMWFSKEPATNKEDLLEFQQSILDTFLKIKQSGRFYKPPVYLKQISKSDTDLMDQYVLHASRDIVAGEFIMEWAGEIRPGVSFRESKTSCMVYTEAVYIQTKNMSNFSEFIPHGPPICDTFTVVLEGHTHILCYATTRIAKDSQLYVNYGKRRVKTGVLPPEPAPSVVDRFISCTEGLSVLDKGISQVGKNKVQLEMYHRSLMLKYIYYFPGHLLERLEKKTLTLSQILDAMQECKKLLENDEEFDDDYHRILITHIIVFFKLSREKTLIWENLVEVFTERP